MVQLLPRALRTRDNAVAAQRAAGGRGGRGAAAAAADAADGADQGDDAAAAVGFGGGRGRQEPNDGGAAERNDIRRPVQ